MANFDLNHQNILITGASKGIGKAVAEYLMQMGARVAVHYRSNKSAAMSIVHKYKETKSKAFYADLQNEQDTIALFESVIADFGYLNTIILNAGIYKPHPIDQKIVDWYNTWRSTMEINLNAVGLLTKLGIEHFIKGDGGRLVYISSRAAYRGEAAEYLGYAASKGGVISLAKTVARSYGKHNIKSFVLAPGFVRTDMAESFISKHGEDIILNELSLNRLTEPKDVTPIIGLMCSGLMDHATGTTIDLNAGSYMR